MSTDIYEGAVSATRFWGGEANGPMIQLTSMIKLRGDHGDGLGYYCHAKYDDVVKMCRAVVAWDDYAKAHGGDDPVEPCEECRRPAFDVIEGGAVCLCCRMEFAGAVAVVQHKCKGWRSTLDNPPAER